MLFGCPIRCDWIVTLRQLKHGAWLSPSLLVLAGHRPVFAHALMRALLRPCV